MAAPTPTEIARGWRPVIVARTFGDLTVVHGAREAITPSDSTEPTPEPRTAA